MYILSRDSRGLSLVEVVISMALVATVATAILAAVSQSSIFSRRIDVIYTASYLAQRRIDLLKRLDFEHLESAAEADIRVNASGTIDTDGLYVRTTEVTSDYDSNPYLKKVKVTVKKIKMDMDGSIADPVEYLGDDIVVETLFSTVE